MSKDIQWCNWSFDECLTPNHSWLVHRDCSDAITLSRGSGKNWNAYKLSLQPHYQGQPPLGECPNCKKYVNGVNPYDNGETWRKS